MAKFPLILLVITISEESSTSGSKYFGIKDMTVFMNYERRVGLRSAVRKLGYGIGLTPRKKSALNNNTNYIIWYGPTTSCCWNLADWMIWEVMRTGRLARQRFDSGIVGSELLSIWRKSLWRNPRALEWHFCHPLRRGVWGCSFNYRMCLELRLPPVSDSKVIQ